MSSSSSLETSRKCYREATIKVWKFHEMEEIYYCTALLAKRSILVAEACIPLSLLISFFLWRQMAVMIFKRGVFESRKKNKSVFRPKIRLNLKEAQSVSLHGLPSLDPRAIRMCDSFGSSKPAPDFRAMGCLPNWATASQHPFLFGGLSLSQFCNVNGWVAKDKPGKGLHKSLLQTDSPQSWPAQTLAAGHLTLALRFSH